MKKPRKSLIFRGFPIARESIDKFFIDKIRDEKKYDSKEELIQQLNKDKNTCIKLAGDLYLTK